MSFTSSKFTFINCEDPSQRFTLSNDEIRQMELKINVAYKGKKAENWGHIADHLYNFYTKIGYLNQPKNNRNVYPSEYRELLNLKDKSYSKMVEAKPWKVAYESPKEDPKVESHLKRHNSWQDYTTNVVSNTDDTISNPSFHQSEYSNNLALQMMKKLNVDTSAEYVTSAQLHMKDRFRRDVHSESNPSDSEFEIAEERMPIKRTRATSEYAEIPVEERERRVRRWGKILAATLRRIKKAKTLEDLQYELDEASSNEAADYVSSRYPYSEWDDNKLRDYKKQVKKAVKDRKRELGLPLSDSDEESSSDSDFSLAEAKLSSGDSDSVSDSSSGSDFEDAEKNMRRRGRSRKKKKKKKRKKRTSSDRPKSRGKSKSKQKERGSGSSIRDMISDAQEAYDDYKNRKRDSDEDSDDQSKNIKIINLG